MKKGRRPLKAPAPRCTGATLEAPACMTTC